MENPGGCPGGCLHLKLIDALLLELWAEIFGNLWSSSSGNSTTTTHCHCFKYLSDVLLNKGFSVSYTDDNNKTIDIDIGTKNVLLIFISGQTGNYLSDN